MKSSEETKKRKPLFLKASATHETSGIRTPDNLIKRHIIQEDFMKKDDLLRDLYLKLSDQTDMADFVGEDDFIEIAQKVLYDYVLIPEASIVQ